MQGYYLNHRDDCPPAKLDSEESRLGIPSETGFKEWFDTISTESV